MFGQNEIVGKRFFRTSPLDSLLVTSIFYTLQGEGPLSGQPAVFVRLAKCNLACDFCDTYFDQGTYMSFTEIEEDIIGVLNRFFFNNPPAWAYAENSLRQHPGINLVITGGEPLLQENVQRFIQHQLHRWKNVQIETNGTITPPWEPYLEHERLVLVCSPKCVNDHYLTPAPQLLRFVQALKFVVSADIRSPYNIIPQWAIDWKNNAPNREIYVSPMNVYLDTPRETKVILLKSKPTLREVSESVERVSFWTPELLDNKQNQLNHEYAALLCMNQGLKLNLQTHLYASIP